MDFKNKVVFITGSNGGLGSELVHQIAQKEPAVIYATARDIAKLKKFDKLEIVQKIPLDLSDNDSRTEAAASVERIDILINNAGVNTGQNVFSNDWSEFDINVRATMDFTNLMQSKINPKGAIVNITSILALLNLPAMARYCASKAALHSLTQALRAHMKEREIQVFEALPGPIDTAMSEGQAMDKTAPQTVVANILEAMESNFYEIYPDSFSKSIVEGLQKNPKVMEDEFASYL
ncbi:MAG: SDR family NAD(P)-dependent oxidoreductase [Campylobacterota bacterium]